MEAFEFFEVPPHLIRVIRPYLSDRWVGTPATMKRAGDPSSTVFRRVLWIISYDAMLRCLMPPDAGMASNAGDMLFLAGGRWWHETLHHNKFIVACAMRAIRRLGMRVFAAKSEAIWFYDWRPRGLFCPTCVRI